jgi:hypothetical protein
MVSGGKQALQRAIEEYAESLKGHIDFMVVSHLDADHVNGIFELMGRAYIEKLYLPYLGNSHRNELLIKLIIANAIIDTDESGDTYEKKFHTLTDFYERDNQEKWIEQERRIRYIKFIGGKESQEKEQYKIAPRTDWEFQMFSREISEDSFNKWNDAIEKKLDGRTIEQLLLEWNTSPNPVATKLKNLAELKRIYKSIERNINHTSIVLAHYPVSDKEESEIWIDCKCDKLERCNWNCCERKCYRMIRHNNPRQKPVTVLTGDAEFDYEMKSTLRSILRGSYHKPFCILQAPHHGAKNEWESLKNNKSWRALQINEDMDICVIPYGHGNTYGHPSYEIMNDLREMSRQNGVAWVEVTQFNKFIYRIRTLRN